MLQNVRVWLTRLVLSDLYMVVTPYILYGAILKALFVHYDTHGSLETSQRERVLSQRLMFGFAVLQKFALPTHKDYGSTMVVPLMSLM